MIVSQFNLILILFAIFSVPTASTPSSKPSISPSTTFSPSERPSGTPTLSSRPSLEPTLSSRPTLSSQPSINPSISAKPSISPSAPSAKPTLSFVPSVSPSPPTSFQEKKDDNLFENILSDGKVIESTIIAFIELKPKEGQRVRPTTFQWQCFASSDQPLAAVQGLCTQANTKNTSSTAFICDEDPNRIALAPRFSQESIYEVYTPSGFNIACPSESYVAVLASNLGGQQEINVVNLSDKYSVLYDESCDEDDTTSRTIFAKDTNDAECLEPWSLNQDPFTCLGMGKSNDKNNSKILAEEIDPVLMEPCGNGEKWVIQSIDCPGDVWKAFKEPYAHAVASAYAAVFTLGCVIASRHHRGKEAKKRYMEYITETILLWISVVTAAGPLIGCPDYAAYGLYKWQVTIPLLLLDSFEVLSFALGALFCKSYEPTLDGVRWSGLSKGCPKIIAMICAVFAGVIAYGLNYGIFLSSTQTFTKTQKTVASATSTWEAVIRATCGGLGVCLSCCILCTYKEKGAFKGVWNFSKFIGGALPGMIIGAVNADSSVLGWSAELCLIFLHSFCSCCAGEEPLVDCDDDDPDL